MGEFEGHQDTIGITIKIRGSVAKNGRFVVKTDRLPRSSHKGSSLSPGGRAIEGARNPPEPHSTAKCKYLNNLVDRTFGSLKDAAMPGSGS
jgi:hypothetical protein